MVIPAIAALVVSNYEGKDRAFAYGMLGGVAGAAIAVGPLIGGWVTTNFSWRWVFAGEVVAVIVILLVRRAMKRAPLAETRPKLDYVGAALSAAGLGIIVFSILKTSEWGWIQPLGALTINGHEITPFGFSVVPFLILAGLGILWCFAEWEGRRERRGEDVLLDRTLLRIVHMRAGLSTLMMQQLILMGTFFVLPVYLQVVLGFDAFETGKRLFPLSVALLIAALTGPKLAARLAPKRVCQAGLVALTIAAFFLVGTIDVELNDTGFAIALAVFGIGAGLLLSQLGNVIMSSVDQTQEQRGRRAPGHGAEPRRLARHGADRRGADLRPHDRLHLPGREQPRRHAGRPGAARRGRLDRHPGRPGRRRRAGAPRRGRAAGRGDRGRGGLRRRPARRAEEVAARRRPARGGVALVHAPPAGTGGGRRRGVPRAESRLPLRLREACS